MAGIGFELKKLFSRRGLFASFRAYGYAGIICTGPMLLGIVLLLGVMFLCDRTGASKQSRELLVCMITYTLLASLTVTSFLSMVVTRFIADMLYEEKNEAVLSSFWGSTGLMLIAGGILYGIFLIFSGVGLIDKFLCFELFGELIVTWNAMSYLTAIKDYRGIMLSFLAAIAVTFLSGALLLFLGISHVEALMAAVCIGYGIMLLWDVVLLYEYFPQSDISAFLFLRWADEFLPLAFTGLCINIGLFAHLVIMWAGPLWMIRSGTRHAGWQELLPPEIRRLSQRISCATCSTPRWYTPSTKAGISKDSCVTSLQVWPQSPANCEARPSR